MANLSELIRQKEQQTEEWKQRKADERDSLNDMNDAAALRVTESTGAFLHYLDVQADNPRFSASNVLLAMEQNPEVTVFNSVKGWNGLNRNVMREEVGMKIRVGDTYVRDGDNTVATRWGVCSTSPRPPGADSRQRTSWQTAAMP